MIKAIMKNKDNDSILLLGISKENVNSLREGKPIHIKGDELGIGNDVLLVYGETEDQLYKDLQPYILPETRINSSKPQTIQ